MADEEFTPQWLENFLNELLQRYFIFFRINDSLFIVFFVTLQYLFPFPVFRPKWMTEVRRDGKDDAVIENLIRTEFDRRLALPKRKKSKFVLYIFLILKHTNTAIGWII